jgi:hypothetical protein
LRVDAMISALTVRHALEANSSPWGRTTAPDGAGD